MNNYHYLKDYLPVRYQANAQQLADRQTCYNFKDGIINDEVKSGFLNKIQEITNGEKTGWAICFIPASTKSKTQTRYKKLAEAIQASATWWQSMLSTMSMTMKQVTSQEKREIQSKASASTPVALQARRSSSLTTSSPEGKPSKWWQKSCCQWEQPQ